MNIKHILQLGALLIATYSTCALADGGSFHVADRQALAGDTKWDYLSLDAASHRLFIAHSDHVDVYDTEQKKIVGTIDNTAGVHGVALSHELDRGYTSNGVSSTVTIFELSTLRVLGTVPTEKKPDAIVFDPFSQRVFVANGDSGTLTVIDAKTSKVVATIAIGGKLEFQAVDGNGRLYVNVESKNLLAVVDTAKLTVLARHDISAACDAPTGLAIDPATQRLFVGCRNQKMAVVAGDSGKVLASLPVGKGCDATAYDPVLRQAFASSGDGTLTVVSGQTYAVDQVVATQATGKTMALDATAHRVYIAVADIDVPAAKGVRQTLKAGSFALLTVAQ
jgi:YVTN family beta-propeller protein